MKKRFSEEQIIGVLRETEAGVALKGLCRRYRKLPRQADTSKLELSACLRYSTGVTPQGKAITADQQGIQELEARIERLALRRDTLPLHLQLLCPTTQRRLTNANRATGFHVAIALIQHQAGCLLLEIRGKRTSLFAHQTPLRGEHARLSGCPESLDHYMHMFDQKSHKSFSTT